MTLKRRLEKLEARKPLPTLDDIIGENAAFAMQIFERVCVPCPDRLRYPKCPRFDCATLIKGFDDEIATLDAEDPEERALIDGVEIWRQKRNRSEWLSAGFYLFAYETE